MNLGLCIANLLKRHRAVEVPGIGVFRITHVPAVYDDLEQAIRPPARQIELVAGAGHGFPITAYLRAERNVDEAKARQLLGKAVADIMDAMSRNGRVLLDGLGYLLADGASLVLKPFETGGFGWKPIKVPAVADTAAVDPVGGEETSDAEEADVALVEDAEVIEITEVADATGSIEVAHATAAPEEAAATTEAVVVDTPESEAPRSGARLWGWIAGIAAVLIIAATWAWHQQPQWLERIGIARPLGSAPGRQAEPNDQRPTAQRGAVVADSVAETLQVPSVDSAAADRLASAIAATDSAATTPPPPAKPAVTYEIIVGSFATMAQANKYVAQMKAKGYELQAIDSRMPGNRKKISWGSYATEEEAYRELARVQKTFEPGAWIAKVDNKE